MRGSGAACACAIAFAVLGILGHPLLASPKPQAQTPAATNPAAAPLPAPVPAPVDGSVGQPPPGAAVSSLAPEELEEFGQLEPRVQELLRRGLDLTQRQLRYQYGSADPAQGGMDCSGTVYYLLNSMGVPNVPRSSDQMYRWAWEQNTFRPVFGHTQESFEFADLRPGDLLFWTGTYSTPNRDPAVSHVMIYLGRTRSNHRRVMVGASEGRRYLDQRRAGVSVFDFEMPKAGGSGNGGPTFIGYAHVPGLTAPQANSQPNLPPTNPSQEALTNSSSARSP